LGRPQGSKNVNGTAASHRFSNTLKGLGLWKSFARRKGALMAEGHTAKQAYAIAHTEFSEALIAKGVDRSEWILGGDREKVIPGVPGTPIEQSIPKSAFVPRETPPLAQEPTRSEMIIADNEKRDADRLEAVKTGKRVPVAGSKEEKFLYRQLSVVAKDRKAGHRDIVFWVFDHLETPLHEIDESKIPSPGAISLLSWARNEGKSDFIKSVWSRMIPSKSEIDSAAGGEQNDRSMDELDDMLIRTIESDGNLVFEGTEVFGPAGATA